MPFRSRSLMPAALALLFLALPDARHAPLAGQVASERDSDRGDRADALARHHPALDGLMLRLERAHGIMYEGLAREGEAMRARGDTVTGAAFQETMIDRLTALIRTDGRATDEAGEAGYAALGTRGAAVLRRGHDFQHEVLSILVDPAVADREVALREAVGRYRSRPEIALPAVPKDMDVLYGHPHAQAFRTGYPELAGVVWAGQWLKLAATEPLTDLPEGRRRAEGLDTVITRYRGKLGSGEPPQHLPSEIPLAPAIAPGLIWLAPEAAMIWDNLSMLQEVLADVLVSPATSDVEASVESTLDFFIDPELAVTTRDDWEIMALRHGIFFQGGFPLAVMTESERNTGGHAAHLAGGAPLMTIPGMPRR